MTGCKGCGQPKSADIHNRNHKSYKHDYIPRHWWGKVSKALSDMAEGALEAWGDSWGNR